MKYLKLYLIILTALTLTLFNNLTSVTAATLEDGCREYQVIFARGSGQELGDEDYRQFYAEMRAQLAQTRLDVGFYELGTADWGGYQYPAVSAGNLGTILGAKVSAGRAFSYGRSVQQGVNELAQYIQAYAQVCPETRYVLAGYSQGAQVVTLALPQIDSKRVSYVATFGDPKLYLPEGRRVVSWLKPPACSRKNLSSYRVSVPDCYTYEGVLGGVKPYQPAGYSNGKLGTWCNRYDFMCGARMKLSGVLDGHLTYKTGGAYASAARKVALRLQAEKSPTTTDVVSVEIKPLRMKTQATTTSLVMTKTDVPVEPEEGEDAITAATVAAVQWQRGGSTLRLTLEKSEAEMPVVIIVDGAILGMTYEAELEITDLADDAEVTIVPVNSSGARGEALNLAVADLAVGGSGAVSSGNGGGEGGSVSDADGTVGAGGAGVSADDVSAAEGANVNSNTHFTPKAPNSGRL